MRKGKRGPLGNALYSGIHPGLPNPVQRTPFGNESPYQEAFGLSRGAVHMLVALLAAEAVGMGPVSRRQLNEVAEYSASQSMAELERMGWVVVAGQTPRSTEKLWAPTARAWRTFFPQGWRIAA